MTPEQKASLLQYMNAFCSDPIISNEGVDEDFGAFDNRRVLSLGPLRDLIGQFTAAKIDLQQFKEKHEMSCREFPYWGFKGFGGQMQLNQFVINIGGKETERLLRNAVEVPTNEIDAKDKIDSVVTFVADKRANADYARSLPRIASVAYVLSYFWEIQNPVCWPVFFNSSKKVFDELGFSFEAAESAGSAYIRFVELARQTAALFETELKRALEHPFWFVEHVLWRRFVTAKAVSVPPVKTSDINTAKSFPKKANEATPNEWLPPIIADLNDLAQDRETEWSKRNNLKPAKAFETKLRMAFTLLGYEARELGQGTGRQPDGVAISVTPTGDDYALVYDAKAREENFRVGTSDREMFEYIRKKSEELRKGRITRPYFLIISSEFDTSPVNINLIKEVLRRTRIPIVMLKASDLLFLIEQKLQDTELTHARLESLFLETGILTRDKIIEILGIR